jgi:hypothetical protein
MNVARRAPGLQTCCFGREHIVSCSCVFEQSLQVTTLLSNVDKSTMAKHATISVEEVAQREKDEADQVSHKVFFA